MQNNTFGLAMNFILKIIILIILGYFFVSWYAEFSRYDFPIIINVGIYKISTYTSFVIFLLLSLLFIIFLIFSGVNSIFSFFAKLLFGASEEKYRVNINKLIECSILQSLGEFKSSKYYLDKIKSKYLSDDEINYLELLKSRHNTNEIPAEIFYKLYQYKAFKLPISKHLAKIEYNLGNYELALEYASNYRAINEYDTDINMIICRIYIQKNQFSELDSILKKITSYSQNKKIELTPFGEIYYEAAKKIAEIGDQDKALIYTKSSLLICPMNFKIMDFLCEILASEKNYDLISEILVTCFSKNPDFNIFMKFSKFSNYDNKEIYDILSPFLSENKYIPLKLSIASYLKLFEEVENILRHS